jgi:hypothetical protein
MATEEDKLYHYIFTTAMEGGIGYWFEATSYRWSKDNKGIDEDYEGYEARGRVYEEDEEPCIINREMIKRGVERFITKFENTDNDYRRAMVNDFKLVIAGRFDADDTDFDADDADAIVQLGLFNEIVYG